MTQQNNIAAAINQRIQETAPDAAKLEASMMEVVVLVASELQREFGIRSLRAAELAHSIVPEALAELRDAFEKARDAHDHDADTLLAQALTVAPTSIAAVVVRSAVVAKAHANRKDPVQLLGGFRSGRPGPLGYRS